MRTRIRVAAAIGTGPSSLYRYVTNRAELLELMADQARGELTYDGAGSGGPAARPAAGQHPHLAAVLADTPSAGAARSQDDWFEHAMARILAGLLPQH
jgi:AcrR family transcriptional regulator